MPRPQLPARIAHDRLLAHHGLTELPTWLPLSLVEVPLVRAISKREELEQGKLPREAYTAVYTAATPDGRVQTVTVKGDDVLGLPYGHDGDVLLAICKLIERQLQRFRFENPAKYTQLLREGIIDAPSVMQIAEAMGVPVHAFGGRQAQRIQDALERFANVRLQAHVLYQPSEHLPLPAAESTADAILARRPTIVPAPPRRGSEDRGATWVLDYQWRRNFGRRPQGEDWITLLRLNPIWIQQAIDGWVAWVDMQAYVSLTRPIAKRLYWLIASQAAQGNTATWMFGLTHLLQACALPMRSKTPSEMVARLHEAAKELVDAQVLHSADIVPGPKRGQYDLLMTAGPLMQAAAGLRGTTPLDLDILRAHVLSLAALGVPAATARELSLDKPSHVAEVLCRLLFLRETGQQATVSNPGAWVVKAIRGEWAFTDTPYRAWRQRLGARPSAPTVPTPEGEAADPLVMPDALALPAGPLPGDCVIPARDAEATTIWAAAIAHIQTAREAGAWITHQMAALAPYAIEGTTLRCLATPRGMTYVASLDRYRAIVTDALRTASDGRIDRVRVEPEPVTLPG
jgi:hypothetical protein